MLETISETAQALLVGCGGVACMLGLLSLVQFLVQGEVTIFSDNFWSQEN